MWSIDSLHSWYFLQECRVNTDPYMFFTTTTLEDTKGQYFDIQLEISIVIKVCN